MKTPICALLAALVLFGCDNTTSTDVISENKFNESQMNYINNGLKRVIRVDNYTNIFKVGNDEARAIIYHDNGYTAVDIAYDGSASVGSFCSYESLNSHSSNNTISEYYSGINYQTLHSTVTANVNNIYPGIISVYSTFLDTDNIRSLKFSEDIITNIDRANWNIGFVQWHYNISGVIASVTSTNKDIPNTNGAVQFVDFSADVSVNSVVANPPPATSLQPSGGSAIRTAAAELSWVDTNRYVTFVVEIDTDNCFDDHQSFATNNRNYSATLDRGKSYFWRVKTIDSRDASRYSYSAVQSFRFAPLAPFTSGSIVSGHPQLNWTSSAGAVSYMLKRVVLPNGTAEYFNMGNATSFYDTSQNVTSIGVSLSNGVVYNIKAIDALGAESELSNSVSYRKSGF